MKMKKKTIITMLLILSIIILPLSFAVMFWLAAYVMCGRKQTLDEAYKWQSDHYDTSFYDDLEKTDYTIESYDGYELHVEFLKNPVESNDYMIISHGYTDNRFGALKYAKMYLDLGFNCIIYDLRGHGENEATFTTYGVREGQDIAELVKDTRKRYENIGRLGLHGESLGAASTITSLKYKPEVDFAVADCGFSDIVNVLKRAGAKSGFPSFFVDMADIGARIRFHYSLKKMRPIDSLDDNEIPVLFMHGSNDDFIIPKNSEDMDVRTKGKTEIHLIDGAQHAESVLVNPDLYREYVEDFLKNI